MVNVSSRRRPPLRLAFAILVLATSSVRADDVVAPDGTVIRRTKLEMSCGDALARFCPDLAGTPGQTRNQVICLKPYRSNLSLSCRAAVNAALK